MPPHPAREESAGDPFKRAWNNVSSPAHALRGGGGAKHRRGQLIAQLIAPSPASPDLPRAVHTRGRKPLGALW
jgi:hypothetical protein